MVLKISAAILGLFLVASCTSSPTNEGTESTEVAEINPKNTFILHCESCHGIDGKKGGSGAADLSVSKLTDTQIRKVILNGNEKGMMPYRDIITSEKELKGMIDFVKSLRTK
jgi:mono/diheme cytochrome c family protein